MTASKFSIGIHAPSFQTGADGNEYVAGQLATYLSDLGLADADGAIAHVKLNDQNGKWATGAGEIPSLAAHQITFLSEAKALGFRTLLAWQTPSVAGEAPWTDLGQTLLTRFDTAAALIGGLADVDIIVYGNEREVEDISNSAADEVYRLRYFALEARCGAIWQGQGKLWAVGADQATANFLGALDERQAAWTAAGKTPDWLALHMYGTGTAASHVALVRDAIEYRTGRAWNIVVSEWALDFENLAGWNTKDYVRDYRARDYAEHFGRALRRERVYGCYFTFKEIVADPAAFPGRMPRQGTIDSLSDSPVHDEPPAFSPSGAASRTLRYMTEGRYANNYWAAKRRGIKERMRSLLTYDSYWG